jgi:predicted phosphodiesterase
VNVLTKRLAILSDIHGNLPALEAVLAEAARSNVDMIVNLGDILSGPLWPAETADRLMALDLPTIAGNHERQVLTQPSEQMSQSDAQTLPLLTARHKAWLASLPATRWVDDGVFCCHGTPTSDLICLMETTEAGHQRHGSPGIRAATRDELASRLGGTSAALVLCGHSHVPRLMRLGSTLVVNPGSVGLQAYHVAYDHPCRVETGSPHARWALVESTAGAGWRVEFRATPYDWESAAARAEQQGRPDWADALRTGFVGRIDGTEEAR